MEDTQYVPPEKQDILLTDVKEEDLRKSISVDLGVAFLSETDHSPTWPVQGILFGPNYRPFISLQVMFKKKTLNVFFLVDTGSPHTYLSMTTIETFSVSDYVPESLRVKIHDLEVIMPVHVCPRNSHYADINILGADFLSRNHMAIHIDYKRGIITVGPAS